jgi:hypothetical protein
VNDIFDDLIAEEQALAAQSVSFFESIAPLISRGWKVGPCYPKDKTVHTKLVPSPLSMKSNELAQIRTWGTAEPNANVCVYAEQVEGGMLFLDKDGAIALRPKYEQETGKKFPKTLLVQSSVVADGNGGTITKGHWYFLQTPRTLALGKEGGKTNITEKETGGMFSLRVHNQYVTGIGSIHPNTGLPYKIAENNPVLPMPDELLDWLLTQAVKPAISGAVAINGERQLIKHGQIHPALVSQASKMMNAGVFGQPLIDAMTQWAEENCQQPLDLAEIKKQTLDCESRYAEKIKAKKNGDILFAAQPEPQPAHVEVIDGETPKPIPVFSKNDMSELVLDGRLGEICQRRMLGSFPIAYAWPSLIAAAGVLVPSAQTVPASGGGMTLTIPDSLTSSFTGLVGPVHTGKSQSILWSNRIIGLPEGYYSDVKAGSSESLLRKLNTMQSKGVLRESILIDLDEWAHLFSKAGIENSSFTSFLHTAFYKRRQNVVLGRGKEIEVNCALSFIGGIVEDEFDTCFGAKSMGGLHDRFTFGLCPEGYNFIYRPFEGLPETTKPISVEVDPEVWDMVEVVRKESPKVGREAEIAVRAARVCASFDGRKILTAKDCETSARAFVGEQAKIRDFLRPNAGVTSDAQCANALMSWLERNAPELRIVREREVRQGLRKTLARLGPGALDYTTKYLSRQGVIWYGPIAGAKPFAGRVPHGYQLLEPGGLG